MTPVDIVLIGRNEGDRLVAALASVQGQARRVVYVDSGSTDDSVAAARASGAEVVVLDDSAPHTAARGRNAGFNALLADGDAPEYVQFIDGDCLLCPGWIEAGRDHLDRNKDCGMVTGWRSEIHPDQSPYNRLADWEWHRPAGPILACGGDMMVRAEAFRAVDGFDPTVIAAEDDEFCTRLRKEGWHLFRLPEDMTRHDADMHRFGQWWQRAVRSGHGFAQVGHLHPEYFVTERRRVLIYGLGLPLLFLLGLLTSGWIVVAVLALFGLSYLRGFRGLLRDGIPRDVAPKLAGLLSLSKIPNALGMGLFHWRRWRHRNMTLIEYK